MSTVEPLSKEQAPKDLHEIYDSMTEMFGRMPNLYAVMARFPAGMQAFLPLFSAVMNEGTVEAKYKLLTYLKVSQVNGCEYCTRALKSMAKGSGITDEQINALTFYQRSSAFDKKEKVTIQYADQVTRGAAAMNNGYLDELRKFYSENEIVHLTLLIGVANVTNRFNDALQVVPDLG